MKNLTSKLSATLPFRSRRYQRVGGDARGPVGLGSDVEGRAGRQHGLLGRTHPDTGHPGLRSFKSRSRGVHKVGLDFLFFVGEGGQVFLFYETQIIICDVMEELKLIKFWRKMVF
jgi:hypothetical protein